MAGACPSPRGGEAGNGHKLPKQTRKRAPGRDENARIFCFVVSLMAHNARAMLHPDRMAAGDGRRVPAASPRTAVLPWACAELGVQPLLRPPRRPPP